MKRAGLQVTAQRLAVYRVVCEHPHAMAEEVSEWVNDAIGSISKQAVYDALNTMTEQGLLRRIQPAGSVARYEHATDNHHHLVCRACGSMEDTRCATGHAPCLEAVDLHGFHIDEAEVIYWGLCPACQTATPPTPRETP